MISTSVYYPYLLSVGVDGSGVNPERRHVLTLRPRHVRGGKAVDFLAADDLDIFRSVDRRRGSPEVDPPIAGCSVAC